MTTYAPTDAVTAIGQINFSGNVIPANWWRHITLPSGRPDQTAITLLSEIVYWYRPAELRNEATGELVGYRKRFRGDKLQRSYQAFADQFGFGKRETADALKRLRDAGLITLELRTIEALDGLKCANVLFVGVVPCAIAAITNTLSSDGGNDATHIPSGRNTTSRSATRVTPKRNTPNGKTEQGVRPMLIQIQRLLQRLLQRLKTLLVHPLTLLHQLVLQSRNIHLNLKQPGRHIQNVLVVIPNQQPSKPGKPA